MSMSLSPPAALIVQLSSLSFILCGLHNDLLIIRFYVTLAYVLVITNVLLSAHQLLRLDSLGWALLGLYINGTSLFSLLRDEKPVHLTDDQAALWRLLYRSGGFSARLFHALVVPCLQVQEISAGDDIPTTDWFYIVFTGRVRLQVHATTAVPKEETVDNSDDDDGDTCSNQDDSTVWIERIVESGQMFDLRFLELFSDYSDHFFRKGDIKCTALTDCKLFCFKRSEIGKIAHHPLSKGVWQSLLINDISITAERFASQQQPPKAPGYDRIFDPLQEWEFPSSILPGSQVALRHPLSHFVTSLVRSLRLPWPFGLHQAGIRQTLLPPPREKPKSDSVHVPFYRRFGKGSPKLGNHGTSILRSGWSLAGSSRQNGTDKSTPNLNDLEEGNEPCNGDSDETSRVEA